MGVSLPERIEMSSEVLFQELQGEAVLLNLETERYYGLDDIGTRIWQLLAQSGDVNAAFEQLLREYNVEEEVLRQDMGQWIAKLSEAKLIKVQPTTNGT